MGFSKMKKPENLKQLKVNIDASTANALISSHDFSPTDLTDLFCKDPNLAPFYTATRPSASATRPNKSSILAETHRTLITAESNRNQLEPLVTPLMSWPDFRLFLSLQNLGRGYVEQTIDFAPSKTAYSLQARSLKASRRIMHSVLTCMNFSEDKITLFTSLLKYDVIPAYLHNEIHLLGAIEHIQAIAIRTEHDEENIARLLTALHVAQTFENPDKNKYLFKKYEFAKRALRTLFNMVVWPVTTTYRAIMWGVKLFQTNTPSFHYPLFSENNKDLAYNTKCQIMLDQLFEPLLLSKQGQVTLEQLVNTSAEFVINKNTSRDLFNSLLDKTPTLVAYLRQQNQRMLNPININERRQDFKILTRQLPTSH